jgi:hypothetical protein
MALRYLYTSVLPSGTDALSAILHVTVNNCFMRNTVRTKYPFKPADFGVVSHPKSRKEGNQDTHLRMGHAPLRGTIMTVASRLRAHNRSAELISPCCLYIRAFQGSAPRRDQWLVED